MKEWVTALAVEATKGPQSQGLRHILDVILSGGVFMSSSNTGSHVLQCWKLRVLHFLAAFCYELIMPPQSYLEILTSSLTG